MQRTRLIEQLSIVLLASIIIWCFCVSPVAAVESFEGRTSPTDGSTTDAILELGQLDSSKPPSSNISVTVANTSIPNGGELTATNDPQLELNVTSEATIEIISVRINDETRRSYVPNATRFSETTKLKLNTETHRLSVVVRTTAGTTTYSSTVIEDSAAPLMTFDAPVSAGFVGPNGTYKQMNNSYTLNKSRIEIAGTIHDQSAVEEVIIEHEYRYWYGGSPEGSDTQIVITDPDESIARSLQLGPHQPNSDTGINTIRVKLRDEFGHVREYKTDIRVKDVSSPNITILDREPVKTRSAVRIRAAATDQVGLTSVGFRPRSANNSYGQQYLYMEHQPAKQSVSKVVSTTVGISSGTRNITLIATDHAGKTTMKELSVNYTDLVAPRIRFDWPRSGSIATGAVQIAGEVYDGQITRVHVETLTPDGDTIDLASVYSGNVTEQTAFETQLDTDVYPATIRVRALDISGEEHTRTIELSQSESVTRSATDQASAQTDDNDNTTSAPSPSDSNTSSELASSGWNFQTVFSLFYEVAITIEQNALLVSGLIVLAVESVVYIQNQK